MTRGSHHCPPLPLHRPTRHTVNMSENDFARKKNKFLPKIHEWVQVSKQARRLPHNHVEAPVQC